MIISSAQNSTYKELKRLLNDKGHFFLDNPKVIGEAVSAGHNIVYLITKEDCQEKTDYGGEHVILCDSLFKTFTNTKTSQGLIAVVKTTTKAIQKPKGNFLILDEVQDPGNVGTLIRSALGADFMDIYLLNCAKISDKIIRSSMGAVFKTNVYECSKQEFLEKVKNWGYPILTADMNGVNIKTCSLEKPFGLVLGNEGNGVSSQLKEISNYSISIPMKNGLESLNVGVAGSIIMFSI